MRFWLFSLKHSIKSGSSSSPVALECKSYRHLHPCYDYAVAVFPWQITAYYILTVLEQDDGAEVQRCVKNLCKRRVSLVNSINSYSAEQKVLELQKKKKMAVITVLFFIPGMKYDNRAKK